jgi:23S rRNA (uridine2479-2'-O)-methyltransferase
MNDWGSVRPRTVEIYTENDQFQHVETLRRNRTKRHKHQEFFVEGVRAIDQALAHGWPVKAFIFSREKRLSAWAQGILERSRAERHLELPLRLMQRLSGKKETSELLAIVAMPEDALSRIPINESMLVVLFDRPASPGNLGTLIRSCDAFRADGLVVSGHAADPYDPETIRATTGSFFALPVVRVPSPKALLPWLEAVKERIGDVQIVGSSAKAERDVAAHDFKKPTILAVGNETVGLSAAYRELCDAIVKIPIHGSATSLNVACAASIMLYEIDRQRRAAQ